MRTHAPFLQSFHIHALQKHQHHVTTGLNYHCKSNNKYNITDRTWYPKHLMSGTCVRKPLTFLVIKLACMSAVVVSSVWNWEMKITETDLPCALHIEFHIKYTLLIYNDLGAINFIHTHTIWISGSYTTHFDTLYKITSFIWFIHRIMITLFSVLTALVMGGLKLSRFGEGVRYLEDGVVWETVTRREELLQPLRPNQSLKTWYNSQGTLVWRGVRPKL